MEVVVLCCNLLKLVMETHAPKVTLARQLVYLLCRIAFRHQVQGIGARADLLDPEMLTKLAAFIGEDGVKPTGDDVEFVNDLTSAFTSFSWDEHKQGQIIWTVLDIPIVLLSPTSQSALVTLFGTARWSVVERLDRKKLIDFFGRLPTADMIAQRIVDVGPVFPGWMRLLLCFTFRPPSGVDTRPLWEALLYLFSLDLPGHLNPSELSFPDPKDGHVHNPELRRQAEEALWMKLFWSSRFFEMECEAWFGFKDATVLLMQKKPGFFERLQGLCFALEEEAQVGSNPATARTKAYTEMAKLRGGACLNQPPRASESWKVPQITPTRRQNKAVGVTRPRDLATARRDIPPVSLAPHPPNRILPKVQDNLSPSYTVPSGPSDRKSVV